MFPSAIKSRASQCVASEPVNSRLLKSAGVVALLIMLAACDRTGGSRTVGQGEPAPAVTPEVTLNIKAGAQTSVDGASQAIREAGQNLATAGRDAAATVGEKVDDMTITASVSARLAKDADLSATKIKVSTRDGDVKLSGPAPSAEAREKATDIARTVPGVLSVDNQLVVTAS
ncbi:MAG: BON domain-containing protein [Polaromonas sp.]|nr:BON domain-containing protein [Polaromonas sp.]